MRTAQWVSLFLGLLLAGLAVYNLVGAGAFVSVLAAVLLLALSIPFLALGGILAVARKASAAYAEGQAEAQQRQLERYQKQVLASLEGAGTVTWADLRERLPVLKEPDLLAAVESLVAEHKVVEDFVDDDQARYVYRLRDPAELEVMEAPRRDEGADLPEPLVSLAERRRRTGERARSG